MQLQRLDKADKTLIYLNHFFVLVKVLQTDYRIITPQRARICMSTLWPLQVIH